MSIDLNEADSEETYGEKLFTYKIDCSCQMVYVFIQEIYKNIFITYFKPLVEIGFYYGNLNLL